MSRSRIFWGDSPVVARAEGGSGKFVMRDGEPYYRIENYQCMPPFFMTLSSGSDHWMFISSNGGITCGRREPDNALFPYETDDRIHHAHATTGPLTVLRVTRDERTHLWKPFSNGLIVYEIERHLYKNQTGNRLVFEEINHDLGLVFSYSWSSGERFGFIRQSRIHNTGKHEVRLELLDGVRNLLPYGVSRELQANLSTLMDAYKQSEALQDIPLGIYSFSSIPTDRAEPCESLLATAVCASGLEHSEILLSTDQVGGFCRGEPIAAEVQIKGKRGSFLVHSSLTLQAGKKKQWYLLADVEQGPSALTQRIEEIRGGISARQIEADIEEGSDRIRRLVAGADGLQRTSDDMAVSRHFSNTLFNIMRGGTFIHEYHIPRDHFLEFVESWKHGSRAFFERIFDSADGVADLSSLLSATAAKGDADDMRLVMEYLPLIFSRRHGDPSRPWNNFSIELTNKDGSDRLFYQGNWRDIFQNWEALAISYPEFIENFVAKFVNATTADGYNPYRISSDSFDWEVLDSEDPWSNIGYWGDHQVNYLVKLLEFSRRYHPGRLARLLDKEIFVYANLPYRIKPYAEILLNPRKTVTYDEELARIIRRCVASAGQDGKLLQRPDGTLHRVGLLEKLLVPVLAKVSNLVPGGGIWMNTQRPEWNDANNALAGYGLSMVTLCYLRRFMLSLVELLDEAEIASFRVSGEVCDYFRDAFEVLEGAEQSLGGGFSDAQRKSFMDRMGRVTDAYRERIYAGHDGRVQNLEKSDVLAFCKMLMGYLDDSIACSRRPDGLYHAYNLLCFDGSGAGIEHLDEMLEGQVAVISSGFLEPARSAELLSALKNSRLYRSDKNSYLLYPDRRLAAFMDKNIIPPALARDSQLIRRELASGRSEFIEKDPNGGVHFNGRFRNADELADALLKGGGIATSDVAELCGIYESVFQHRRFTGRSGTMFKYEGLGCIYWHMVSKLLLATAEVIGLASHDDASQPLVAELSAHFHDIKAGLGLHDSPAGYGAFPSDPYSHTPGFMGVQQPGMTGQVKEDVITRFAELGVQVEGGELRFRPVLLRREEFTSTDVEVSFPMGDGEVCLELAPGSLAFSLCGVPVVYRLGDSAAIRVEASDGSHDEIEGSCLGSEWSEDLFQRRKRIRKLVIDIQASSLR